MLESRLAQDDYPSTLTPEDVAAGYSLQAIGTGYLDQPVAAIVRQLAPDRRSIKVAAPHRKSGYVYIEQRRIAIGTEVNGEVIVNTSWRSSGDPLEAP